MKNFLTGSLILAALAAPAAYADMQHEHKMMKGHESMAAMPQGPGAGDGEVKKLDAQRGMVTLQHGDVPGIMPAMTMDYRVADPKQLAGFKPGDKVHFTMEKRGDQFVLTHIETMKR